MATKVHMEALSPTMEEGRLVKWTKQEGDAVKTGDTLAEVETDKAVMELVARADGQLIKVLVPEGSTVPVGNVVAYIGAPGEKVDGGSAPAAQPTAVSPQPSATPAAAPTPAPVAAPADAARVKASPLAKRIAKETGVDLARLQGSGPGGRVVKRDLEGAPPAGVPAPLPTSSVPVVRSGAPYDDVPLTQIRKTIAKRLAASLGRPSDMVLAQAVILGVLLCALVTGPFAGIVALSFAALVLAGLEALARRQIGGYTGDVLGAAQQVTEIAILLALSALW